jgi:hypothetical protein
VAVDPQRVVEGLVEDPYRRHVLQRREVLAAEDQDLVGPECLPQGHGGGLVNGLGQVDAVDLGADEGTGGSDLEAAGQCLGHVILLKEIRRTRQILLIRSFLFNRDQEVKRRRCDDPGGMYGHPVHPAAGAWLPRGVAGAREGRQLADRAEEPLPRGSADRERSAVAVGRVADHHHVIAGYFDALPAVTGRIG